MTTARRQNVFAHVSLQEDAPGDQAGGRVGLCGGTAPDHSAEWADDADQDA